MNATRRLAFGVGGLGCLGSLLAATLAAGVTLGTAAGGITTGGLALLAYGLSDAEHMESSPPAEAVSLAPHAPVSSNPIQDPPEERPQVVSSSQAPPMTPVPAPVAARAAPPEPAPPAAVVDSPRPGTVTLDGDATVVLLSDSDRYALPADDVVPGTYRVQAAFGTDPPFIVGQVQVRSGGDVAVSCNPRMGVCTTRGGT